MFSRWKPDQYVCELFRWINHEASLYLTNVGLSFSEVEFPWTLYLCYKKYKCYPQLTWCFSVYVLFNPVFIDWLFYFRAIKVLLFAPSTRYLHIIWYTMSHATHGLFNKKRLYGSSLFWYSPCFWGVFPERTHTTYPPSWKNRPLNKLLIHMISDRVSSLC